MPSLNPGDRVSCKLREGIIVNSYESKFDEIYTFEIISSDSYGYYIYVPQYFHLKKSFKLTAYDAVSLRIHNKFIGEQILYIEQSMISCIKHKVDGCYCVQCGEFYHMAAPNQPDGSMICWSCRTYR
jgi:hypothetical protein